MTNYAYEFKHTDGTNFGSVFSMESNGPGAESVPIQLVGVDFSVSPHEIIIRGDITDRFPAAAINNAQIIDVDINNRILTIAGNYAHVSQLDSNSSLAAFSVTEDAIVNFTVKAAYNVGANTLIHVNEPVPVMVVGWVDGSLSSIRGFSIISSTYDDYYYPNETGSRLDDDGNTHIPLHILSNLAPLRFDIVGVTAGAGGSLLIEDAINGCCQFRPGSRFSVQNNALAAANAQYVVSTAETSGSFTVVGSTDEGITVAGDQRRFFIPGRVISINGGQARDERFVIENVTAVAGNTYIETTLPLPAETSSAQSVVCVPSLTIIKTVGTIPVGTAVNGVATPALPTAYTMSAPPAITPTTAHNFLISWRIAGDHVAKFTPGCPLLIKGNGYYEYQEFPVQSATFSLGMTHIVTQVYEPSAATPTPDASGQLIFPAPVAPTGYLVYTTNAAFSPIKLVGKGSPSYNSTTTWGQAIQDNSIALTENFADGLVADVISISPGNKTFTIGREFKNHHQLVANGSFDYAGDSSQDTGSSDSYVISNVVFNGLTLEVTTVESIPGTYAGNGTILIAGEAPSKAMIGQLWYEKTHPQMSVVIGYDGDDVISHGIITQTIPATEYVDMGNNLIVDLADASAPKHAVNVRTADLLYIAKTGGSSSTAAARSGTMTGSLNIGVLPNGKPDVLGLNVTSAPVTLYGSSGITLDAAGTGNVHLAGSGNVLVDNGNVTVGTGTDNVVIQNSAGDAPTMTFTTTSDDNEVINLGSNKIVNLSTPTQPLDAANKQYVDGLANGIVWLQPVLDPNLFADNLTSPPFIEAPIVAVTTGVSSTFSVAGNIASKFTAGQILTLSGNALANANTAYTVQSAANSGGNTVITVSSNTILPGTSVGGVLADRSVPMHKTYIVGDGATGEWSGLDKHVVTYSVVEIDPETQVQTWGWVDILGRAVINGDRFGVFIEPEAEDPLMVLPSGNLANTVGKIATVTSTSPMSYSFYTPVEPYAFSVTGTSPVLTTAAVNDKSPHFGHSYTFRGTWGAGDYGVDFKWIEFAGPSMLAAGAGLRYAGNVLNVGAGAGIITNADTVQLDTGYANGIYVRLDGTYPMSGALNLGSNRINNVAVPNIGTDAANKTYVDNQDMLRVAKTGDSMSGTLTFTAGTVTGLAMPVGNQDAATKVYTDNAIATRVNRSGDTMTGSLVMSGAGVTVTLPNSPTALTDAANKAYVDLRLPLTGGTLSGPLVLSGDPAVALGAATKQYVDNTTVHRGSSTVLATDVSITFSGTGEVLGLPATPSAANAAASKAYVDGVIASKPNDGLVVHLAGTETITGAKTFSAAMALNNAMTVKANGVDTNVSITTTDITLTGTPVSSGGAANITAIAGSNSSGTGGNISLYGGNGATSGGNIVIIGGQGSAGTGGNVTITTGTGTTSNGQLSLVAGVGSINILPTGALSIGGAVPTGKSQALVSNSTTPGTLTPSWQLVGTRVAAAPANSAAPGIIGNWFADDSYFYVYGATGWRRMAISTF